MRRRWRPLGCPRHHLLSGASERRSLRNGRTARFWDFDSVHGFWYSIPAQSSPKPAECVDPLNLPRFWHTGPRAATTGSSGISPHPASPDVELSDLALSGLGWAGYMPGNQPSAANLLHHGPVRPVVGAPQTRCGGPIDVQWYISLAWARGGRPIDAGATVAKPRTRWESGVAEVDLGIPGLKDYKRIGLGGFAKVYSAFEAAAGRRVAVKVLDSVDEAGRRSFDRECLTMGQTTAHDNIVTMFRAGTRPRTTTRTWCWST